MGNRRTKERVLVIVVAHNSARDLARSLPALYKIKDSQLVVVDNGSIDRFEQTLSRFPGLIVLRQGKNRGFATAVNRGIRWGMRRGFNYFALINPDVFVTSGWLKAVLKTFRKDRSIGIVQPVILLPKDKLVNSLGNDWHYLGFSTCRAYRQKLPSHLTDRPIAVASGAAMVIKRVLVDRIGLLEEAFFLYSEDSEYSYRAWKAGYQVYLSAQSVVRHNYQLALSPQKWRQLEQNRIATIVSLYSRSSLFVIAPFWFAAEFGLIIVSFFRGLGWAKLLSYQGIFLGFGLRPKRQKIVVRSEKDLENLISGDIVFPFLGKITQSVFNRFSRAVFWLISRLW